MKIILLNPIQTIEMLVAEGRFFSTLIILLDLGYGRFLSLAAGFPFILDTLKPALKRCNQKTIHFGKSKTTQFSENGIRKSPVLIKYFSRVFGFE
ncbi:MAG: hypothetical protein ACOCUQ_02070 [Bacteroidota bacterium]